MSETEMNVPMDTTLTSASLLRSCLRAMWSGISGEWRSRDGTVFVNVNCSHVAVGCGHVWLRSAARLQPSMPCPAQRCTSLPQTPRCVVMLVRRLDEGEEHHQDRQHTPHARTSRRRGMRSQKPPSGGTSG